MKRWAILFIAVLFFSGHALADRCSRSLTMTANHGCESHLQAAYQSELASFFQMAYDGNFVVVANCSCILERSLVTCSSMYSVHSCFSSSRGEYFQSVDPIFRGDISYGAQIQPRNPYQDLTQIQRNVTRDAASHLLQKIMNQ